MIRYDHCPVCKSADIRQVLNARDHTVSGEEFAIWECGNCSLRFTQDIPEPEQIGRYYQSEEYISHSNSKTGLINSLYLFVRKYTLRSKKNFVRKVTGKQTGSLLDLGAGTGAFLREMQRGGWDAQGLEPDEQAIRNAKQLHGVDLLPVEQLFTLPEKSFDAITLWHVLEHVHGLHSYFARLKILCRTAGRIIIAVPNYTSHDAQAYGAGWAAYDVPRHLYHFSPRAMKTLAEAHGCRVLSVHPMWFDSFYVSMLSEKYRSGSSGLIKGGWNGLVSDLRLVTDRNRASSLMYVIGVG